MSTISVSSIANGGVAYFNPYTEILMFDSGFYSAERVDIGYASNLKSITFSHGYGFFSLETVMSLTWLTSENVKFQDGSMVLIGDNSLLENDDLANSLTGSSKGDQLFGLGGNDSLAGGSGNDLLDGGGGNDVLDGGPGIDTARYRFDDAGLFLGDTIVAVTFSAAALNGAPSVQMSDGFGGTDTLRGIERVHLIGTPFGDRFTGSSGDDTIDGRRGNDTIDGGGGFDTASYASSTSSVNVSLISNSSKGGDGTDTLVSIEGLRGSNYNDTLTGSNDSNRFESFDGGAGNDIIDGNGGIDRVDYTSALHGFVINLATGTASARSGLSMEVDTLRNIEDVLGSGHGDRIIGNSGNNVLSGAGGNDIIDGGSGADTMIGGAGRNVYVVDNVGDVIIEEALSEVEPYWFADDVESSISYTLGSDLENLTLSGTANLNGTGNSLANRITGNSGNNVINGGTNADTMTGGAGNDTYFVQNRGDLVVELPGGGTDTVSSSITYTLTADVEKLTLTGTSNLSGTGNNRSNTLTGNDGNNSLNGADGNDTLAGGLGNDVLLGGNGNDSLDGGLGNDTMTGGAGNDRYVVQSSGDRVVEASGGGIDSVTSSVSYTLATEVENLTLTGSSGLQGHGNSLNNIIVGNVGSNILRGSSGNDTLTGGAGLDIFRFSSAISASTNVDTITDFNPVDDILQLENSVFTKLTSTGVLSASNFRASTTGNAADSNDYVLYETDTGQLFYDADGNGAGAKVLIATLSGLPTLTSADIFVT